MKYRRIETSGSGNGIIVAIYIIYKWPNNLFTTTTAEEIHYSRFLLPKTKYL